MLNQKLVEMLIQFRKSLNLNQTEFGESIGFSQSAIANVESGKRELSRQLVQAIEEKYGKNVFNQKQCSASEHIVEIPLYNVSAAAGAGTWLDDEPSCDKLYFDSRWLRNILKVNPKHLHAIFATGDSMDSGCQNVNSIKNGDLLLVDSSNTIGNNGIFVIKVNDIELRVKRLVKKLDGTLIIISDNSKYPEEVYRPDETEISIEVMGKVVWNGSKENI